MSDDSCAVQSCAEKLYSKAGYCRSHHYRWRKHGDPLWKPRCSIEGCERKFLARNYCKPHYRYLMVHGEPVPAVLPSELSELERFNTFVTFEPNGLLALDWAHHSWIRPVLGGQLATEGPSFRLRGAGRRNP